MLLLVPLALALDCGALADPEICAVVNQTTLEINALTGTNTIDDLAGKRRHRPIVHYENLVGLRQEAEANGCIVDGYGSGLYDLPGATGSWSGLLAGGGTLSVLTDGQDFDGDFDGSESGNVGRGFGRWNRSQQVVGNWDTGYLGGNWSRIQGSNGYWYALKGECADWPTEALDPWWKEDLTVYTPVRIFLAEPWQNPMTGIATMDAQCQAEADAFFGTGQTTFLAAVTDQPAGLDTPVDRFPPLAPVALSVERSYVTATVEDFFDYTQDALQPVDVEVDGTVVDWDFGQVDSIVWWGDFGPGAPLPGSGALGYGDCEGWTNPLDEQSLGVLGPIGGIPVADLDRFYAYGAQNCADYANAVSRMYCIETR